MPHEGKPRETLSDLAKLPTPRVSVAEIVAFAERVLQHPEVVEIVARQINLVKLIDEESERNEEILNKFTRAYLIELGGDWKDITALKDAFYLVTILIKGEISSIDADAVRQHLSHSPFINFS